MLSDDITRKFENVINLDNYEIETPQGWVDINSIMKTVPYEVWLLILEDNTELYCADNHIVFTAENEQIFVKDLVVGESILTKNGKVKVKSVECLGYSENMYDVDVNSKEHQYYSNGVVSHNTTTSAAYLCYELCFSTHTPIAILANKAATANEILDRVKKMLEDLPWFLKPGVLDWNKTKIFLDNGNSVIAAACGAGSIRGQSIKILLLDEFSFVPDQQNFYTSTYPTISSGTESKVIMISTPCGLDLFYKIYSEAVENRNKFKATKFTWENHPERDLTWESETRRNIGDSSFEVEYNCTSYETLINIDNKEMQIGDLFNLLKT